MEPKYLHETCFVAQECVLQVVDGGRKIIGFEGTRLRGADAITNVYADLYI